MSIYGNKDFMGQPAPPGYVAGLGRGASGFTTRSDIGPARDDIETNVVDEHEKENENDDSERYQDPDNEVGLFAGIQYDQDDDEADKIYESIDEKMDERRKIRREEREKAELERYRKERPKIQQQFADLKRGLTVVSEDEWANLPDVGDLVGKNRKKSKIKEKFTPVPDSLLDKARMESSYDNAISLNGSETSAGSAGSGLLTNFVEIGQANNKVFNLKLGQVSDSKGGQSTIDPKGYLTELSSVVLKTDAEIGDIKKARSLLNSVTGSNPKYAPGWIASARLEEVAGKVVKARQIMKEGCERCPDSEDVWLEAARLNTNENAKIILAESIRHIQDSVKIWLAAAKLETEIPAKKRVLRKALENIPTSVTIWKAAIDLEESHDEARILLASAVELVPSSVDLWLALAKLEPHENARKVVNNARKAIPTSHEIWIAAAHLEEQNGNSNLIQNLINRAITELSKYGVVLNRDQWIKLAEESELEYECIETCQAIIRATLAMNIDPVDQLDTWLEDAESSTKNKAYETARAMYAFCLNNYPDDSTIWERAAFFEKDHGTSASLEELLDRAVKHCPHEEILWLMWAKEEWIKGNVEGAGGILARAFEVNPNSEQIWLAAVKLEVENSEPERAQTLLAKARIDADTEKVWMKSIVLERQLENTDKALELLEQANEKFPKFDKLWMIKGQIYQQLGKTQDAREAFNKGTKLCPNSITLWILSAELEESVDLHIKARSVLERARLINPKTPELWLAAIRLELKFNNPVIAKSLLSKAIQECPDSNILWAEAIIIEPRAQRKSKLADALKNCNADPLIISVMARNLWAERKIDKARNMFVRSLKQNPDHGDTWAWYLKFEKEQGTEEEVNEVIQQCIHAEPKHGELWQKTAKSVRKFPLKGRELLEAVESQLDTII